MEFKINVKGPNGKQERFFQYPYNNVLLERDKLLTRYSQKDLSVLGPDKVDLKMIREAETLPETWPALQTMFFDDEDRLWVATIVGDFEIYEWWILQKTGEVITRFEWSRDKPIKAVKNGHLYTQEKDDRGVSSIVKYKIEME